MTVTHCLFFKGKEHEKSLASNLRVQRKSSEGLNIYSLYFESDASGRFGHMDHRGFSFSLAKAIAAGDRPIKTRRCCPQGGRGGVWPRACPLAPTTPDVLVHHCGAAGARHAAGHGRAACVGPVTYPLLLHTIVL